MRSRASWLLSLCIMALSAWAVLTAMAWPWKAALFPLVIGIPIFCLASAELLLGLFRPDAGSGGKAVDFQLSPHLPSELVLKRTLAIFGWILGFFFAILLVGFSIAVPLFVFLYLKAQGREGWVRSAILTLVAWAFFYGLFTHLLHLPFPDGWIQAWIGI